ncbi:hypothetical protein [Paenarthrobacter sp. Y-19]|uniref:hypothetical protein n=1 Tax=Paenarthrobacter sp. Y-19 TaxID=3031125 RepID=UPI0023DCA76F|nr:hypothetical protein [Paenarthrobacter sp. Y-19]
MANENETRKKQPGDTLIGLGSVIAVLAVVVALVGGANGPTPPLLSVLVGLVLVVIGYLQRRSARR